MTMIVLIALHALVIAGVSATLAYIVMRWSFSSKRHAKLAERFNGLSVVGLNSGILLALGLAFIFNDISTVHSRAKTAVLQEADAIRTLGRMSLNIDPSVGIPLMAATKEYTEAVLNKEWLAMRRDTSEDIRSGASSALTPLTVMSDIVYSSENIAKLPTVTSTHLAGLVSRIREQRLQRIDASDFSMGLRGYLLVSITLITTAVLFTLTMLTKPSAQFISNFFLFLVTFLAAYLAFSSQNPFHDLDAISPLPLQEAFDRLNAMTLTRQK
ncbi:MAG: hypothetical protein ACKO0Z_01685 [Betaproteobacteria bacterium]